MPAAPQPPPDLPGGSRVPARGPSPKDNPRVLAGRYRLDSVLGRGSMGTVWAATDQVLHRQVAIKEIDFPAGTPAAERAQLEHRTLREARAIAALSNPYVITLFDILTLDNGPVIVMELLRSRSLAEILRKVGRLPDGQAATVGIAVASGLLAAHAAGITHRDVKPGNVLICDDGRIKLTDFGIARSTGDQTMTATGLLLGSPAYIAPEVANGVPAGPISDAWSLGGLLFASVEGRPPFDQGTAIATLTSVVKDPVPPHPHSGRLGGVVSGLLVKTPSLRMRVDRALTIMRGIADDPSGTNLAIVAKIPRDGLQTSVGAPGAPTGGATPGRHSAADSSAYPRPSGSGTGVQPSRPPLPASARPPATSPADASTRPPGTPAIGPFGPGQAAPGGPAAGASGPGWAPPAEPAPGGPRSVGSAPSGPSASASSGQHRAGDQQDAPSIPRPGNLPQATGFQQFARPTNAGGGGLGGGGLGGGGLGGGTIGGGGGGGGTEALPPPPWAQSDSAALAPLPADAATEPPNRMRLVAAVVVAVVAAVAGYFGVRIIADLATEGASAVPVVVVTPSLDPPGIYLAS